MQSTIFVMVSQRFITSIDNSTAKLDPLVDFGYNVIRTLRYLKTDEIARFVANLIYVKQVLAMPRALMER